MDRKLDLFSRTIRVMISLFKSLPLAATRALIEKTRRASETDKVCSAESFRPVQGKVSGPRWHWLLMFTRLTWFTRGSMSCAMISRVFGKNTRLLPVIGIDNIVEWAFPDL